MKGKDLHSYKSESLKTNKENNGSKIEDFKKPIFYSTKTGIKRGTHMDDIDIGNNRVSFRIASTNNKFLFFISCNNYNYLTKNGLCICCERYNFSECSHFFKKYQSHSSLSLLTKRPGISNHDDNIEDMINIKNAKEYKQFLKEKKKIFYKLFESKKKFNLLEYCEDLKLRNSNLISEKFNSISLSNLQKFWISYMKNSDTEILKKKFKKLNFMEKFIFFCFLIRKNIVTEPEKITYSEFCNILDKYVINNLNGSKLLNSNADNVRFIFKRFDEYILQKFSQSDPKLKYISKDEKEFLTNVQNAINKENSLAKLTKNIQNEENQGGNSGEYKFVVKNKMRCIIFKEFMESILQRRNKGNRLKNKKDDDRQFDLYTNEEIIKNPEKEVDLDKKEEIIKNVENLNINKNLEKESALFWYTKKIFESSRAKNNFDNFILNNTLNTSHKNDKLNSSHLYKFVSDLIKIKISKKITLFENLLNTCDPKMFKTVLIYICYDIEKNPKTKFPWNIKDVDLAVTSLSNYFDEIKKELNKST